MSFGLSAVARPSVALAAAVVILAGAGACTMRSSGTAAAGAGARALPAGVASVDMRMGLQRDASIAALTGEISPARLRAIDSALVSFGTRNTYSDTLSPTRGIGAARRWIHSWLTRASADCNGCLRVAYDTATVTTARDPQRRQVHVVNVLATLPGRDTGRVIVMGGHYDSCICNVNAFDATSDAPGADDDGSGTAAVMELARAFGRRYPRGLDATIIFALYAGEEQGLLGSTALARRLRAQGYRVTAAFTDDIIGNVAAEGGQVDSTSVRIFAEGPDNSPSRELGRYVWASGAAYMPAFEVVPVWRLDRIGRGGDHRPFVELGYPGVRFTERLENYNRQHLPTDDLAHVDFNYVAQVARLNAVTVASLAAAPPTPERGSFRRDSRGASGGQAFQLRWGVVPGAASYEVVARRTTAPTWERVYAAGQDTTFLLPEQLDDLWAGVRAVGASGHRSLVLSIPAAPPPATAQPAPAAPGGR